MENQVRTEFRLDHDTPEATDEMKATFDDLGYIIIRGLLSTKEIDMVAKAGNSEPIQKLAFGIPDSKGVTCFISSWNQPGNDVTGMVARSQKVAGTVTKLMGGEVYHYHTRLVMKDAAVSGTIDWHQDYGYWYQNGLLFPDIMSVAIAVTKCTKENGCIQIIPGSQKCGRLEHQFREGQSLVDEKRVEELQKRLSRDYVELEPGDALFFHGNMVHRSGPNTTDDNRWVIVCSYNMAHNNPTFAHHHSSYVPLDIVPNSAIMDCQTPFDLKGKELMDPLTFKSGQLSIIMREESLAVLHG